METQLRRFSELMHRRLPKVAEQFTTLDVTQIDQFENELGIPLPYNFRRYLERFCGRKNTARESLRVIGSFCFLSLHEIQNFRRLQLSLFESEPKIQHIHENKVQPVFWDHLWVPVVDTIGLGMDQFILDLHPGKNGKTGQIIRMYPGIDMENSDIVVSLSFEEYFEKTCDFISLCPVSSDGGQFQGTGWFDK